MAVFKCKMCGGNVNFTDGATVGVCDSCGTKQTLPKTGDDLIANLFNRANNLRLKCEFDKALALYEKILEQDDGEAEAHWGAVLCKYGIEYVEDPQTRARIPTCHRTLFEAVTADPDYLAAVDYASAAQQQLYEAEARAIDRLQKNILSIVKNEKPFDVFICYKESDENGKRTVDSALANDIYYQLTREGFKVFYAAITLEDKLGQEYEPYIFAALQSAKVMLAVGTKPEYFTAVWVKNEWGRFLNLMKTDRSKLLIPCYRDMDPYDLPEEFAHLQAQDMSKIGFVNDLVRGIRKVLASEPSAPAPDKETAATGGASVAPLLKRAALFLEDGNWEDADAYCEKVLDQDPENAQAYLYKLMAELYVHKQDDLANLEEPFDQNSNYQKAVRFGDEKTASLLKGYIAGINERNENARLTGIYNDAISAMNAANTEAAFKAAAETFKTIPGFKDADALAEQCLVYAENCRKNTVYASAKSQMIGNAVGGYEAAINSFRMISGWKDADEQIAICQRRIEEIKAKAEADRLEAERRAEVRKIAEEKAKKKAKKIFAIGLSVFIVCIIFVIVLTTVIIPNGKYNSAIKLYNIGKYEEAITAFKALNGYKDSTDQIAKCENAIKDFKYNSAIALIEKGDIINAYESLLALNGYKDSSVKAKEIYGQYKAEKLKTAKVGDYVVFGSYEQDNNASNGKEDVEWLVLAKEGGKVLVISRYALDCQQYNAVLEAVTWETCSLRKWLNGAFISNTFSSDEQNIIQSTTVTADKNPSYSTSPGNNTTDKVFLLSITEVNKYFSFDSTRQCRGTVYCYAQGAYKSINGNYWWWLRSPGDNSDHATFVNYDGSSSDYGHRVSYATGAVRPAMWISLEP